jgi:ABC-type antimicrobial peptide transport system permease subunit
MKFDDLFMIGFSNLWKTKLRTVLTTLGVVIGIGALASMVSFGTGMEKNITETFKKNDLFTSLHVTPGKIDLEGLREGDVSSLVKEQEQQPTILTDSILSAIRELDEVEIAYPELTFRARMTVMDKDQDITVAGVPYDMKQYPPFNRVSFGSFFEHDSSDVVLISWETLKRMKIIVEDPENPVRLNFHEEDQQYIIVPPDSLLGKPIYIKTAVMDYRGFLFDPMQMFGDKPKLPVTEKTSVFIIGGIVKRESQFSNNNLKGDVIIPFGTAKKIPRLAISNIWDAIAGGSEDKGYGSIYVRVKDVGSMDQVINILEEDMGLNVFAIADQLKEVRRAFLILDGILGAIGTIALIVAGLGIVNTMLMSILERTREIGIMKAIGGSERQIRWIFFVESGAIGFLGAIFGLILGWLVTIVANQVANAELLPAGVPPVNFFYFPVWLILGSILFSIVISLAAGLYPAIRAANIDPVRALRHD